MLQHRERNGKTIRMREDELMKKAWNYKSAEGRV
jgi:hypothetical protein